MYSICRGQGFQLCGLRTPGVLKTVLPWLIIIIIIKIMIIVSASLFLSECYVLGTRFYAFHMQFYVILAYFLVSPPVPQEIRLSFPCFTGQMRTKT